MKSINYDYVICDYMITLCCKSESFGFYFKLSSLMLRTNCLSLAESKDFAILAFLTLDSLCTCRRKSHEVTRHLFESGPGTGIDLAAINIQRGRDHGLAPYNVWRSVCQLEPATTFTTGAGGLVDHPEDAVLALKSIYK